MALAALPQPLPPSLPRRDPGQPLRRDPEAREHLAVAARPDRPVVGAHERVLAVADPLGALLPGGGVRRGTVTVVTGAPGAGATAVAFQLVAAATTAGEWAAALDPGSTLGALAAAEAGVALERFAVVRRVPPTRFAEVVAALLDGVTLVLAEPRGPVRERDARRLEARARERGAVLVVTGTWPGDAALRLRADGSTWHGLDAGSGLLAGRELRVHVEGRGAASRARSGVLARAG